MMLRDKLCLPRAQATKGDTKMWRKGLLCHMGVTRECVAIVPSKALQLQGHVSLGGFLGEAAAVGILRRKHR